MTRLRYSFGATWRWLMLAVLCLAAAPCWAAVAKDAAMSGGNSSDGKSQQCSATTSCSSTGMTVGGSATCLIGAIAIGKSSVASGISMTWNSVSMTAGPSISDSSGVIVKIFVLPNPATGNKTLAASWTGTNDAYMTAISFTGTDTSTCTKASDNNTHDFSTITSSPNLTMTSDANGATFVIEMDPSAGISSTNFNTVFINLALNPNAAASYQLAGTSNNHTFTLASSDAAVVAGVHIIAPAGGAATPPPTQMMQGCCLI